MNTQELIDGIINLSYENYKYSPYVERKRVLELVRQLDEPQSIKLKDVIKRIKDLDIDARKVWLNEILDELGSDYRALIYKDGYEQGKLEGLIERDKPVVPQFVADWLKYCKRTGVDLYHALEMGDLYFCNYANQKDDLKLKDFFETENNQELFARAWLDGYEVEKEKRYLVKLKNLRALFCYLAYIPDEGYWTLMASGGESIFIKHTRKQLEEAGFGWVFDCPGIEIEEVEE